ncbi:MAG: helix-turn-helix transcriptional regulator [Crocinitomicaceae bacterium]|nr:helix-turn-helix transcriptional regulator [Crocinitomicaceae bacterium]
MAKKKEHIQNNIRKLRFFNDEMTQQELADKCGVTRQTIVAIEKGKYFPTLELAFRISHVFGTTLDEVFTYDSTSDPQLEKVKKRKKK